MSHYWVLVTLFLSAAFIGCSERRKSDVLPVIDKMAEAAPEKALLALDSINYENLSESDKNFYRLLSIKASDKAYKVHTSDSAILRVLDYMSTHRDEKKYAEALYYAGRVYSDMGDYPEAIRYFQKALDLLSSGSGTQKLKAQVLSQTGRLLNSIRLYDQAVHYLEAAVRVDSVCNDSLNLMYDSQLLGAIYLHMKKYDRAYTYIQRAKALAHKVSPIDVELQKMYLAAICLKKEQIDSALLLIRGTPENIRPICRNSALAYASEIYLRAGKLDTAYSYASQLVASKDLLNKKCGYHVLLSPQMKPYLSKDSAALFVYEYRAILEKYLDENEAKGALIQNAFYNYERHKQERIKAERAKVALERWTGVILFVALVLLVLVLYLKNKSKTRLIELHEALSNVGRLRQIIECREDAPKRCADSSPAETAKNETAAPVSANEIAERSAVVPSKASTLREQLREELMNLYTRSADGQIAISPVILQSEAYHGLKEYIYKNELLKYDCELWQQLESVIQEVSPDFKKNLQLLTSGKLTTHDLHTALLIKCGVLPSQMMTLLGRTKGTISSRRESLCYKVFDEKLGTKVIDGIIRLL